MRLMHPSPIGAATPRIMLRVEILDEPAPNQHVGRDMRQPVLAAFSQGEESLDSLE